METSRSVHAPEGGGFVKNRLAAGVFAVLGVLPSAALAQATDLEPEPEPEPDAAPPEEPAAPAPSTAPPLVVTGYVDVGFAKAQGNGTSWPASFPPPAGPADYYVDTFAPAVNSRGEAASTAAPPGTTIGGFLPRSAAIGSRPSFLINTANLDLRYTAPELPILIFTRLQAVPRLYDPDPTENVLGGEYTRLVLEQAFGRITPIPSAELAISVGKFDSVFGIEYLQNEANFRIGVTPSLLARYTTGQSTGVKVFYRFQIIPLASALSLNVAGTNSGTFVEALQGPSRSLTGRPVATARLGYELNLARVSVKLGGSVEYGPRNDQSVTPQATQTLLGADLRLIVPTLTIWGEYVHVEEEDGSEAGFTMIPKLAGTGPYPKVGEFYAHGFWVQAAEELPLPVDRVPLRVTLYARYEQRHADFPAFSGAEITVDRITGGVNVGLGESLQLKAEYLVNRELEGAPQVPNDVFTSSAVWTW
jgi:hypothetical protein